jgi:dolichol-phosphate mannosyltransferase
MKTVNIICPCFNEEDNIHEFYDRSMRAIQKIVTVHFKFIFIDNSSTDNTVHKLREIAANDSRVKIIVNSRNFGQVRSPYWALMQSSDDAAILIAADLQDPPEEIINLVQVWQRGWKVVLARKINSNTNSAMNFFRKLFYKFINSLSDFDLINDANGFGIYDKDVIKAIKELAEPYPYLRGLVCEIGMPISTIVYKQDNRTSGKSKSNIKHLIDVIVLALVNTSFAPIRIITIGGFFLLSIFTLILVADIMVSIINFNLNNYTRILLEIFLVIMSSLLFGIGVIGEYLASVLRHVRNRPIVVEKERINF